MSARHDNADGPEDIDAAFAEIVAGLERDEPMARWPEEEGSTTQTGSSPETGRAESTVPDSAGGSEALAGPRDWSPPAEGEDEGHYEPPEPPPLPVPGAGTLGGIVIIALGLTLLLVPGLAGLGTTAALPLGLVAISGGITWLLFRMRRSPPDPDDEGAQL